MVFSGNIQFRRLLQQFRVDLDGRDAVGVPTHEYVSKLLGKATIDTNTYGQSKGRNGSYSTNWQLAGRELLMPDEVRTKWT